MGLGGKNEEKGGREKIRQKIEIGLRSISVNGGVVFVLVSRRERFD